ncbi:hypothetical protein [Spiroplasma endosymbiont of Polydrusus formosus]|uniref:hypothetical protein n=1 Tax=Spiroplasma endosymbiont of Polydrusus formosus TaxID=3139326 RepID=UPI0035B523A4
MIKKKFVFEKRKETNLKLYTRKNLKDYQINYADSSKTPDLTVYLTKMQYTFDSYNPWEIRKIHCRQFKKLQERLEKQKLIKKNLRKERRYQKI